MKHALKLVSLAAAVLFCAAPAFAQTADEIVERHLAALGGRAVLSKATTQVATGTITVSTQMGNISGALEISRKAPNKARSVMVLDLSALGGSEMVIDQRCDGVKAWVSNSLQGDREITGNQLQGMLNATFPTSLLTYKEDGGKVELTGKDKVGDRAVHVLVYTPKAGTAARFFVDAETFQLIRSITTVESPETGPIEQTTDTSDYRAVDGIQVPFAVNVTSSVQTIGIVLTKVEINKPLDDAIFTR